MNKKGQSLIEVLIGIALAILFIAAALGVIVVTVRIHFQNQFTQAAAENAHGLLNQLAVTAEAKWHTVFDVTHGADSKYHLIEDSGFFLSATGTQSVTIGNQTYTRWFTVEDVFRDSSEIIVETGGTLDPSTLKVKSFLSYTQGADTNTLELNRYLTRSRDRVFHQTDWSGGSGQEGPITSVNNLYATSSNMEISSPVGSIFIKNLSYYEASSTSSNIDDTYRWAWNDVIGWLDFKITSTVVVSSTKMTGYASSGIGYIAFDCATSPSPDCTHSYQVANDGTGVLSGWAWNDIIGWVSFDSATAQSSFTYNVAIDTNGYFSGWAWNDIIGWISFNCSNTSTCATSDYKVKTSWSVTVIKASLISSIFDTQIVGGAAFNNLMWQGTKPTGTSVLFQLASSNSSTGPWNYLGPDATDSSYYEPAGPNLQIKLPRVNHNNHRYVRYKVTLESDANKSLTPKVDDIIINWSP